MGSVFRVFMQVDAGPELCHPRWMKNAVAGRTLVSMLLGVLLAACGEPAADQQGPDVSFVVPWQLPETVGPCPIANLANTKAELLIGGYTECGPVSLAPDLSATGECSGVLPGRIVRPLVLRYYLPTNTGDLADEVTLLLYISFVNLCNAKAGAQVQADFSASVIIFTPAELYPISATGSLTDCELTNDAYLQLSHAWAGDSKQLLRTADSHASYNLDIQTTDAYASNLDAVCNGVTLP